MGKKKISNSSEKGKVLQCNTATQPKPPGPLEVTSEEVAKSVNPETPEVPKEESVSTTAIAVGNNDSNEGNKEKTGLPAPSPSGSASKPRKPTTKVESSPASTENIFELARKLQEILKGKSNKTCMKVMNMVGSLHGIRCIPSDRPIGQSTTGTTKVVKEPAKPKKGKPTPRAAWKQTDSYKNLSRQHEAMVKTIKSCSPTDELIETHIRDLRDIERKLKALHSPTAGDH
jgi:hypothetical protein